MDIQNKDAMIAEIEQFKEEALKMHIVQVLADTYTNTNLFDHNIDSDGSVIWYKAQARQLWDFWQAAKAQAVPEGFVLVHEDKISSFYQDDGEPENFCNSSDDWDCLGDGIEKHEIMIVNKHTQANISTDKLYGAWKLIETSYGTQWKFELFKSESEAKQAMIKAQEPAPLKLGDLVEPIDHRYTLASGCERYPYAYVVNTNPFQLMSEEGDMYWCCTVEAGGYKLIKSNDQLPEAVSLRMIREGLLAPVEAQEQSHD